MLKDIATALRPALVMTGLFAGLLGVAYPLAMTAVGQALFPHRANGSLIRDGGQVVGAELIGQQFTADRYFHPRPSAAVIALASAGSNLGPASQALADRLRADVARETPSASGRIIPPDLVTASASGLDPHISPEAALYQVDRVARARQVQVATVRAAVGHATEHPLLGILGEPRVNVLLLNRALDGRAGGR